MYACMHVCMYACMYACLDVCMYECMHAWNYALHCVRKCRKKMKSSWDWKPSKTEGGGLELEIISRNVWGYPPLKFQEIGRGYSFFFPWYPSPSKIQPKPSHPECLYIILFFFLVWGRGGRQIFWDFVDLLPVSFGNKARLCGHTVMCCSHRANLTQRKHTLTCKMHYLRTMVGIGLNM